MRRLGPSLLLFVPTAAAIGLVWFTDAPLGVPGEWTWARAAPAAPFVFNLASLTVVAMSYVAFVAWGARRLESSRTSGRAAWLLGLAAAGGVWLWTAQENAPEGFQLSKAAWVLYFPGPSGYFTEAKADDRSLHDFLSGYERRMAEGDVLHIGTHPPGLIVVFRGLIALCRASPALTDLLVASEPESVRLSFDAIAATAPPGAATLTRIDRAVLWLAAFLAQGVAALTVIPLFALLRRTCSARASWLAAALWPAVPAVAVFLPKSDAFYPCLTALLLWLWLTGADRSSWLRCALAGFALCLALCFSLAFLPIAFLGVLVSAWELGLGSPRDESTAAGNASMPLRRLPRLVASAALGFALPILLFRVTFGMNLLAVWSLNLRNHAAFYQQFTRTYWKWILVGPLEFAVAAGLPLAALALLAALRQWRCAGWRASGPAITFAIVWGLLWISGKNLGETARLWIFLTPCLIWIAAPQFDDAASPNSNDAAQRFPLLGFWSAALAAQLAVCAAIVTRVVGFQYG